MALRNPFSDALQQEMDRRMMDEYRRYQNDLYLQQGLGMSAMSGGISTLPPSQLYATATLPPAVDPGRRRRLLLVI